MKLLGRILDKLLGLSKRALRNAVCNLGADPFGELTQPNTREINDVGVEPQDSSRSPLIDRHPVPQRCHKIGVLDIDIDGQHHDAGKGEEENQKEGGPYQRTRDP